MTVKFLRIAPVALLSLAAITLSDAATLVSYDFGTTTNVLNNAASVVATNLVASDISYGSSGMARYSAATFGSSGAGALGLQSDKAIAGSLAGAISAGSYLTFSLTPDAGQSLSLTSFSFYANATTGNAPTNYALQIDTGAGFTTVASGAITTFGAATPGEFIQIDLTGYTSVTSTALFRMAFYDPNKNGYTWNVFTRIDDITINGSASAIPEPASLALIIGALTAGSALVRRPRKNQSGLN